MQLSTKKSLIKRLVKEYGGGPKFARLLGVEYRTVTQWIFNGHIPNHHLMKLTPLSSLYNSLFETTVKKPLRPRTTLPTLLRVKRGEITLDQAAEHLEISLSQLEKMYEAHCERLETYVELFPRVERREIPLSEVGRQLGLDRRTVHQVYRAYGYVTQDAPVERVKEDEATLLAQRVILGQENLVDQPAWRTVHRRVCALIRPITLNYISPWPKAFRAALLSEAQGNFVGILLRIFEKAAEQGLALIFEKREKAIDWKKASAYEILIPVLLGEKSVEEVAEMRGGDRQALKTMFDMALGLLELTYDQVCAFDVPHQLAVVEWLQAVNAAKRRLKKEYHIKSQDLTPLREFTVAKLAN